MDSLADDIMSGFGNLLVEFLLLLLSEEFLNFGTGSSWNFCFETNARCELVLDVVVVDEDNSSELRSKSFFLIELLSSFLLGDSVSFS